MKRIILLVTMVSIFSLSACKNNDEKARELGFLSYAEQQEALSKGYQSKEKWDLHLQDIAEEKRKEQIINTWKEKKDWNFLLNACIQTAKLDVERCDPNLVKKVNLNDTSFTIFKESEQLIHVVFGRKYRESVPLHLQDRDMIIHSETIYTKINDTPNSIKVEWYDDVKGCKYTDRYFLWNGTKIFVENLSEEGRCSDLIKTMRQNSRSPHTVHLVEYVN